MPIISTKVKKLSPNAIIPTRGSSDAAGYDLYACLDEPIEIYPHGTIKVSTGIAVEIPPSFWLGIFARSGLATKQGLRPANCTGVVDADYRGPIIVALHNDTDEIQVVEPNDRIGQAILLPKYEMTWEEVDQLNETNRNAGGFGSTGK